MKKLKLEELGRITPEEYRDAGKIPVVIVLDNVRSLHNVGSAFRTADAFRVEKIYLTGITGTPPNREIQKTALGATESVPWEYVASPEEIVAKLRQEGYVIAAVEQTDQSTPLNTFEPESERRYVLVFGNEVNGVSEPVIDLSDLAIEVPQMGSKHSLNVSVCLGIVVWHFFNRAKLNA